MEDDRFFIDLENDYLKRWYSEGIVDEYLSKNDNSDRIFSFLDGPITANNPMGVHHGWGRTYKDIWQRFYNLLGAKQRFQNGFDCHGLWVEVEVEKELGLRSKKDIENLVPGNKQASIAKFVDLCKERVKKFSRIQTEQSKRLGYLMDWENSYYTMSDANNYMIWRFLKTCHDEGWIYRGEDVVPWCYRCECAISQHEILTEDYKVLGHESVYFVLPIVNSDENLLVWTTTPWTIPGNTAVSVSIELDYALVEQDGKKYWLAQEAVAKIFGEDVKIIKVVKGDKLVGLKYLAPFDYLKSVSKLIKSQDKFHTVVATDNFILPISTEEGTGIVHLATACGVEDFKLGKLRNLPILPIIGDNASYLDCLDDLAGKNAKIHPEIILNHLKDYQGGKFFLKTFKYKHRYPVCWRCKSELVWKTATEWYIGMDIKGRDGRTLRERLITVAKQINWLPSFGLERELDWLNNMHDWLISKKRYWGLALPIWMSEDGKEFEVIGSYEELKSKAVEGWDKFEGKSPHRPDIDQVVIRGKNGKKMYRIADVGNVWLDAGIVPFSTISRDNSENLLYLEDRQEFEKWFPADFITESFPGQFKNWFYSLLVMSTVLEDRPPFKTVLGFGTMLDEKGHPFHKSAGNAIEFVEAANRFGADLIRWVCARNNPANNVLFGDKIVFDIKRRIYLPLWNVYKFYVEFSSLVPHSEHPSENVLDKWLLSQFNNLNKEVKDALLNYDAQAATFKFESFITDLSTWYLRRSRERAQEGEFAATLKRVLIDLSVILSPFMPFISEKIYTSLTSSRSVNLADWPKLSGYSMPELARDMRIVRQIAEVGHSVRKNLGIKVRQPIYSVVITAKAFELSDYKDQYLNLLKAELNVKLVDLKSTKNDEIGVDFDTETNKELMQVEGEVRDLIRQIQSKRKELGLKVDQQITVTVSQKYKQGSYQKVFEQEYAKFLQNNLLQYKKTEGIDITL